MRAPFVAARHVLWVLPPAVLLLTRVIESDQAARAWRKAVCAIVGALGLAAGWADMELANMQRRHVLQKVALVRSLEMPVYYLGQFGFAYYCESIGMAPLPPDALHLARPFAIVEAVTLHPGWNPELPSPSVEPRVVHERGRFPLNTISPGVNFYATGNSDIPLDIGKACETFYRLHTVRE
jgi:hypothetical protein